MHGIRRDIVLRNLRPGDIIRDSELTARYGVSSSPIREALGQLEAEKLIEISTNRAKRVGSLDRKTTEDFFALYKLVALAGFSWGAANVTPVHIARMEAALHAMAGPVERHDPYEVVQLSHQFFFAVYEASDNSELISILSRRLAWVDRLLVLVGIFDWPDTLSRLQEIVQHFVAGNSAGAVMAHYLLIHELETAVKGIDFTQFS